MKKAIITITEYKDGTVNVGLKFSPKAKMNERSVRGHFAMRAMEAINAEVKALETEGD